MDRKVFEAMVTGVESLEQKVMELYSEQKDLGLKRWLDNQDVCQLLGIGKRTLQSYREKGLLPYSRFRHKIFYKKEDIERLLKMSHYSAKNNE
ncbi:DNA-binding protein [Bacteroides sp. 224]|nr:DNA-binding protein [Bacteroides sp. 224]